MEYSIEFLDLFDWHKESDRHYMFLLQRHKENEIEWEKDEYNKRLPAIIEIQKPIYETECNTRTI